jgi:flagellar basal-body rod protein FlgG
MWTAVSGAIAQQQAVDTVANNLANADTLGFKKDLPTFKEYLSTVEREPAAQDVPRGPIKDKDFYPLDGRDQSHVVVDATYTSFKQGNLRVTQNPLDVALDGPGFLEVSTPNGVRYTRQGSLKLAMDGRLVTTEGYPVLAASPGGLANALPATTVQPAGQGRPDQTQGRVGAEVAAANADPAAVAARFINLRDKGHPLQITAQGEVYAGDELVAKLGVVEFGNVNGLRKQGGGLFANLDPNNAPATPAKTEVRQGMLETSNVNPIEEMTNLIKANRMFEQDLKAMKTYGDLMGREVNDIGKL